jgi:cytochrome c2
VIFPRCTWNHPILKPGFLRLLPVVIAFTLSLPQPLRAVEIPYPFVSGFERFVRPGDLSIERGGRLLIGELGCGACHLSRPGQPAPKPGPRLDAAGRRLQHRWLARYLADPAATDPGTTMPDVLHGLKANEKVPTIEALVAFLSTRREAFPPLKSTASKPIAPRFWDKGDRERGRVLFHQVGCVACHEPASDYRTTPKPASELEKLLRQLDPEELKELGLDAAARPFASVPHGDLPAKFPREALAHFLLNPESVRPAGRMPSLKLDPAESADLVAYLRPASPSPAAPAPPARELVERGRGLFVSLQCANCHSGGVGIKATRFARRFEQLNPKAIGSCLGNPSDRQPRYRIDKFQRKALTAAMLKPALPVAVSLEQDFLTMNCYACHVRNRKGGVGPRRRVYFETAGHVDLGDEGRLPPPLDGVGRKLKTGWLSKVLDGTGDVRPYMLARMPRFPAHTGVAIPKKLLSADRKTVTTVAGIFGNLKNLPAAGRTLTDRGCVQCHPIRGERLPGVVGIDLAGTTERIQPDWMREFLFDPAGRKTRTRMPTFFPKGKSNSPDVLQGNVDRQLAALWAYMADIGRQPLPEKIVRNRVDNYELVPKKRPLLLRTFMQQVGQHAIAVGFPEKIHFAFDARGGTIVQAWRGRFLDAHATWFNRFIPPAAPLGVDIIGLPGGLIVSPLQNGGDPWPTADAPATLYRFRGFRLDKAGVPTFLYSVGDLQIQDRLEPQRNRGLRRRLTITTAAAADPDRPTAWVRAHLGKTLKPRGRREYVNEAGLAVSIPGDLTGAARLLNDKQQSEWRIPLVITRSKTLEIVYRW